jgi:hypothetical protein
VLPSEGRVNLRTLLRHFLWFRPRNSVTFGRNLLKGGAGCFGQYFPLEFLGRSPKLAARERPLLLNGEVCFALDRSRSNGCFGCIIDFRK